MQGTLSKDLVTHLSFLSKDFQNDRGTTNQKEEQNSSSILVPVKLGSSGACPSEVPYDCWALGCLKG